MNEKYVKVRSCDVDILKISYVMKYCQVHSYLAQHTGTPRASHPAHHYHAYTTLRARITD